MAGTLSLTITHRRDLEAANASRRREFIRKLEDLLHVLTFNGSLGLSGQASGATGAQGVTTLPEGVIVADGQTQATGTVTFTAGTGAVGATIGGTLVTVTWATSDYLSAVAFAAAVNANSTVNPWVVANVTSAVGASPAVTTLTAINGGTIGNKLTLALSGTGVTVSGATLTGGAGNAPVTFAG